MSEKTRNVDWRTSLPVQIAFISLLLFWILAVNGHGQTTDNVAQSDAPKAATENNKAVLMPVLTNYKEIKIGMAADEVKERLGKAKVEDKDGFYYEISDDESAQILLDADKKVRFISVMYSGENSPKFEDVFGKETAVETQPDGRIYKLIRYPEAGYWVAYSRTAGDKPTVTVTMQKLLDIFLKTGKSQ